MNFHEITIKTNKKEDFIDITDIVKRIQSESNISSGIVTIFSPHTTAGITINENCDPDVVRDMLTALDRSYPQREDYHHIEGNSPAHIKASYVGSSSTVIIDDGNLKLGTWQGIYFCEFDGPRTRKVYIKLISE